MKIPLILFFVLVCFSPAFAEEGKNNTSAPLTADNIAFENIRHSNEIRCGYMLWPALLELDPNTKKFSGLIVDFMDEISKASHIKYTWASEMSTQSYVIDLDNGKADIACGALAGGAEVGLNVYYTEPIFFATINTFVKDTKRFSTAASLKQRNVRFAVVEGSAIEGMMKKLYPDATHVTVSQLQGPTQAMMDVTTGKADAIVMDSMTIGTFVKNNPNTLSPVAQKPISVIAAQMAISTKEPKLLAAMNMIIQDLRVKGIVQDLIDRRGLSSFLTVDPP